MTDVYVDRRLLSAGRHDEDPRTSPGVAEALAHLEDAGHEVVVVDGIPDRSARAFDAWLLTPDRADCSLARRHGLRTVLVGPHLETRRPTDRCDEEARDLGAAALGILAADAMGAR